MKELTPINEMGITTSYHLTYEEEVFKFLNVTEIPPREIVGKTSGKIYPVNSSIFIQTDPDFLALEVGRDYTNPIKDVRTFSKEELILEGRKVIERIVNLKKDVEEQLTSFANEHNFSTLYVLGTPSLRLTRTLYDGKKITHIKNEPGGLLIGYTSKFDKSDFSLRFKRSHSKGFITKINCTEIKTGDVKWFNGVPVYCVKLVREAIGQMVDWAIRDIIEKHGFSFRELVSYMERIQRIDFKLLQLLLPYAYQKQSDIYIYVKTNTDYCRKIVLHNSYAHSFRKNGREIEFTHFSDCRNLNWSWEMREYYASPVQDSIIE